MLIWCLCIISFQILYFSFSRLDSPAVSCCVVVPRTHNSSTNNNILSVFRDDMMDYRQADWMNTSKEQPRSVFTLRSLVFLSQQCCFHMLFTVCVTWVDRQH